MAFPMKQNDTLPPLKATLKNGSTAVPLTDVSSVRFKMRAIDGNTIKVDSAATIIDSANGRVQYDWSAGDTDTAGTFKIEFELTYATGGVRTYPTSAVEIVQIYADLD